MTKCWTHIINMDMMVTVGEAIADMIIGTVVKLRFYRSIKWKENLYKLPFEP